MQRFDDSADGHLEQITQIDFAIQDFLRGRRHSQGGRMKKNGDKLKQKSVPKPGGSP
jgi:hypothetical protein